MVSENMHGWNEKYRQGTTPWDRGAPSPALQAWLSDGTLQPCRILVPGCGRGHEVIELARLGFAVTALDFAPSAIELLQESLDQIGVSATLVVADALQWQPEHPFDAIYEQTCLCALDPTLWQPYARQLHAWLRPGGSLFALFMQTGNPGGPPFHCELTDMRMLFPAIHWHWVDAKQATVPHPSGLFECPARLQKVG